ncbi:MAG TPA: PfkB family carbohydrate kinase [Candidatus Dormibacteraeota bacterium]|nr:PfkB family carbohydrate kinase [Candidatus Dormibacteraeota bacterium]
MIGSVGEGLVDLVAVTEGGRLRGFRAHPGGSPYNLALAVARLGGRAAFIGRLSRDPLGRLLADHLAGSGVHTGLVVEGSEPSAVAFVTMAAGEPVYDLRLEGTAAAALRPSDLAPALRAGLTALHFGSLGIVLRPSRQAVLWLCRRLAGRVLLSFDLNLRPEAVRDWAGYRRAVAECLRLADLVRASVRDLEGWGEDLRGGVCTVVTRGAAGSRLVRDDLRLECPSAPCRVVDTVGAGDVYGAGLLVALAEQGALSREGLRSLDRPGLERAMRFASAAAALACERAGAAPPERAEVEARLASWSLRAGGR